VAQPEDPDGVENAQPRITSHDADQPEKSESSLLKIRANTLKSLANRTWLDTEDIADDACNTAWTIAIAATAGPFVTAFCTELGRRCGGTVADWASRVHFRRRNDGSAGDEIVVKADDTITVFEFDEQVSDEARLALLNLDITDKAVKGHRLKWSPKVRAWVAVGMGGSPPKSNHGPKPSLPPTDTKPKTSRRVPPTTANRRIQRRKHS
jgi:hypothetical protein